MLTVISRWVWLIIISHIDVIILYRATAADVADQYAYEKMPDFIRILHDSDQNPSDPNTQFSLGQFYRYSCRCESIINTDGDMKGAAVVTNDCESNCRQKSLRLYSRTRDLIIDSNLYSSYHFYSGMLNDLALMVQETDIEFAAKLFAESIEFGPNFTPAVANLASLETLRGNISGTVMKDICYCN